MIILPHLIAFLCFYCYKFKLFAWQLKSMLLVIYHNGVFRNSKLMTLKKSLRCCVRDIKYTDKGHEYQ